MNTDEALLFLAQHQPLPPTSEVEDSVIQRFDEVRQFFAEHPDPRALPLLLNAFGEGDGHGVYQLVEDALSVYPRDEVVKAIECALKNRNGAVRYWNAQIASAYPDPALVAPLGQLLRTGTLDERIAAAIALEQINTEDARRELEVAIQGETQPEEVLRFARRALSRER